MTDLELATAVFERLTLRESEARLSGNRKQLVALAKAHRKLEKIWNELQPHLALEGGPVVFSGGTPKELPL
jgi:hypothetical protein